MNVSNSTSLTVGIAGACARGANFKLGCEAAGLHIIAACDVNTDALAAAATALGAPHIFSDYETMLDTVRPDAVIIGTPMPLHVPQALAALERGIHVLSEVPAGVSMEECRQLVAACAASKALYMMAENYTYIKNNVLVRELARRSLFGDIYYAEGEYLHELKELNETTRWRRQWQTGIAGVTYGTHSLGPILQWMPSDRVTRVCCADAGRRYTDPRGVSYAQTTPVMLCRTARGALIKIRVDMLSNRPHAMTNYSLQGTDGCYESGRGGPCDRAKLWLRALSESVEWLDLDTLMQSDDFVEQYLPARWRNPPDAARRAGHGGGDYFVVLDFVNAITGVSPCPIGIHEAMDVTLPGLVSQQSALEDGRWLDVPDSRTWTQPQPSPQLHMLWPETRLDAPPALPAPQGYVLRQYRDDDHDRYVTLMRKAGFADWPADRVAALKQTVLPDGFFVLEHVATRAIVATAIATHKPTELHPYGGELGWVAGDPAHKGKRLGAVVTAAATARLIRAGYRRIYLMTDDVRLPAIKTYLDLE
jgi:predicted dehydrogenase/GNAT superfamily N-acetyltransferase